MATVEKDSQLNLLLRISSQQYVNLDMNCSLAAYAQGFGILGETAANNVYHVAPHWIGLDTMRAMALNKSFTYKMSGFSF